MRLLKVLQIPFLFVILLSACKKEADKVSPAPKNDTYYQLPQGNAPYDQEILSWYKKYNTYVLYRFSEKEYKYGITGLYPAAILMKTADTLVMPAAVNFLKDYWFHFYTDDFLKKYLPFKILLAGLMVESAYGLDTTSIPVTYPMAGLDYLIIPTVNSSFSSMTMQDRITLKTAVNGLFLETLLFGASGYSPAKITPPDAFFELSPYDKKGLTANNKYQYGFLELDINNNQLVTPGHNYDLMTYLYVIISTPERVLNATLLSADTDSNGLIRKKYNVLTHFFKEQYDIDIQAIGNKQD
jgi:hypothetical protein